MLTPTLLSLKEPIEFFNRTITGTTVAHLGHKHIKQIKIVVPNSELLEKTRNMLEPLFELELNLRLRNKILRQTRNLLLPRLISGKLDIQNISIEENSST